jgi:C-terminal processing protease CtpA/Prc
MTADGKLDGVILDNRFNTGGADTVLKGTLAYFIKGNAGTFINRQKNRTLSITANDIGGSQKAPIVVLVGKGTASFGEIFTGIMKDLNRGYIIGETSDGNVEILWGYDFDDGSRAWIAHDSFRPLKHPSENWEKTGIIPDETVLSNWDEVTNATDPVIQAALKHFDDVNP